MAQKKKGPKLMTPEDASRLVLESLDDTQRERFANGADDGWTAIVCVAKASVATPLSTLESIRASVERVPYVVRAWLDRDCVFAEVRAVDRHRMPSFRSAPAVDPTVEMLGTLELPTADMPTLVSVEIVLHCEESIWPQARDALLKVEGLTVEQFRVRVRRAPVGEG